MKKALIILFFLMYSLSTQEASYKSLAIAEGTVLRPYDALISAVVMVESGGNNYAYNAREGATGAFQVRPIRLRDYNMRTGSHLKMSDMYDFDKAKTVFLYYLTADIEKSVKAWNGKGKQTEVYWQRVSAKIDELQK